MKRTESAASHLRKYSLANDAFEDDKTRTSAEQGEPQRAASFFSSSIYSEYVSCT